MMDKWSFCGRTKKDVNILIAGVSGHICDSCIEQAHQIILEEFKQKESFDITSIKLLKPIEIQDSYTLCHLRHCIIYSHC